MELFSYCRKLDILKQTADEISQQTGNKVITAAESSTLMNWPLLCTFIANYFFC